MTELAVLLHHGRVLVDADGSIPAFATQDQDRPLADVLALAGADLAIGPTAQLPDGRRVHLLGTRDREPDLAHGGTLATPASLEDPELAALLERATAELDPVHAPAQRPGWFRPGWFDLVEAWIDAALAPSGARRTAPVEPERMWSISAVARVRTDRGELWLKAPCPHFRAEARIHAAVARVVPDLVPRLIAIEEAEGWVLMAPMAGTEDDRHDGAGPRVATAWAEAQLASLEHLDALRAAGLEHRGIEATLAEFRQLLEHSDELALLSADELAAARAAVPAAEALLRELWAAGLPDTLAHGDLHLGNVAWDSKTLRVYDWTDGCVTHPFLDVAHMVRFVDDDEAGTRIRHAYLEPWRRARPDVDVDRAMALAPLADLVLQTVTFERIAQATEPQSAWELGGVVARQLRALPQAVAEFGG